MKIIDICSDEARLLDKRVRIEKDSDCRAPHSASEMLFAIESETEPYSFNEKSIMNIGLDRDKIVWQETIDRFSVWTTEERIQRLCGPGDKYRDPDWLVKQAENEVKEVENWLAGFTYGVIAEHWDAADRRFAQDFSCWGYVGKDAAFDEAKEHEGAVCAPTDRCPELF